MNDEPLAEQFDASKAVDIAGQQSVRQDELQHADARGGNSKRDQRSPWKFVGPCGDQDHGGNQPDEVGQPEDLERLAQGLLEYETLTGAEINKVMAGEQLNRGGDEDDTPTGGSSASVTAIPKTAKPKPPKDSGMEPEPSA